MAYADTLFASSGLGHSLVNGVKLAYEAWTEGIITVRRWTEDYKQFLSSMMASNDKVKDPFMKLHFFVNIFDILFLNFSEKPLEVFHIVVDAGNGARGDIGPPEASVLASPLLDLLRSREVSYHKEAYVRRSVLFAASCILISLHPSFITSALTEGNADILKGLEWVRTWALNVAESDTNKECYTVSGSWSALPSQIEVRDKWMHASTVMDRMARPSLIGQSIGPPSMAVTHNTNSNSEPLDFGILFSAALRLDSLVCMLSCVDSVDCKGDLGWAIGEWAQRDLVECNLPNGVESDSLVVCNASSSCFDGDHDDIPDGCNPSAGGGGTSTDANEDDSSIPVIVNKPFSFSS
nr:telomere length regulation protein TEL2 homolog isoform X1 [Ipomoea batatas]